MNKWNPRTLKDARVAAGMTQEAVARELCRRLETDAITGRHVSEWERTRGPAGTQIVMALAAMFGLEWEEFYDG